MTATTQPVEAPARPAPGPWTPSVLAVTLMAFGVAILAAAPALAIRADTTVPVVLAAAAVSLMVGCALSTIGKHRAGHHVNRAILVAAYLTLAAAFVLLFAAFALTGGGSR